MPPGNTVVPIERVSSFTSSALASYIDPIPHLPFPSPLLRPAAAVRPRGLRVQLDRPPPAGCV